MQLTTQTPTMMAFQPVSVLELRESFLAYHEHVLASSCATIHRYRAATQHLANFAQRQPRRTMAHEVQADRFVAYLRAIEVAPNGHPNAVKRRLRQKGVRYILQTCRSLYNFAMKHRHLPPYSPNPFSELPLERMRTLDSKPIFVFDPETEALFFRTACDWAFPIHFTLAKTGLRVGELAHLMIEDVDIDQGWLRVKNRPGLGWQVKTGEERDVPLVQELAELLKRVIRVRDAGPVFLRPRFVTEEPSLRGDSRALERAYREKLRQLGDTVSRDQAHRLAKSIWRDAGAIKTDEVRASFITITSAIGLPDATCPKSWRHSFATLLQDARVDPLIRQQVLGHRPTDSEGLGMTARYTHTRRETRRTQIEEAIRQWPESLTIANEFAQRLDHALRSM